MRYLLLALMLFTTPAYAAAPTFDSTLYKGGKVPTNATLNAEFKALKDFLGVPGHGPLTDAAATLTWGVSKNVQVLDVPITANRAVTLSTSGAIEGARFRIVRSANATGSFNENIGTGPLKALGSAGTWAEVGFNGTAWVLTASGSL